MYTEFMNIEAMQLLQVQRRADPDRDTPRLQIRVHEHASPVFKLQQ